MRTVGMTALLAGMLAELLPLDRSFILLAVDGVAARYPWFSIEGARTPAIHPDRNLSLHGHSSHNARGFEVNIVYRARMNDRTVVPQHDRSRLPAVPHRILRTRHLVEKKVEKRAAFSLAHSKKMRDRTRIDEQQALSGRRVNCR